jgi:hypothetical protein
MMGWREIGIMVTPLIWLVVLALEVGAENAMPVVALGLIGLVGSVVALLVIGLILPEPRGRQEKMDMAGRLIVGVLGLPWAWLAGSIAAAFLRGAL